MTGGGAASTGRALVTGATGFVGGALVRHLVAEGWLVHVLTGPRTSGAELAGNLGVNGVHGYDGSRAAIERALGASAPDVVFHLASRVLSEHRGADVAGLIDANITLGIQLADAMVAGGLHRLVVAGSHWQHFGGSEYEPVNLYAATKQALQTALRYYTSATPLRLRILTLFETYGPSDPRPKLLTLLNRAAQSGERLDMSPGEQRIDIVHVDDVARAFVATAATFDSDAASEREYAATSGQAIPLRDFVAAVADAAQRPIHVNWGGRPYRRREVMEPWRGNPPPGWTARIGLAEGLQMVLQESSPAR